MKSAEHLTGANRERLQPVGVPSAEQRETTREFDLRFEFGVGPERDRQVINEDS